MARRRHTPKKRPAAARKRRLKPKLLRVITLAELRRANRLQPPLTPQEEADHSRFIDRLAASFRHRCRHRRRATNASGQRGRTPDRPVTRRGRTPRLTNEELLEDVRLHPTQSDAQRARRLSKPDRPITHDQVRRARDRTGVPPCHRHRDAERGSNSASRRVLSAYLQILRAGA
jgi:hypothetical protein